MSAQSNNFESLYPKLERPTFQSTVPPHLLGKLTDQERYVVEMLSRSEQQNEWIINAILENNRIYRDLDRRLQQLSSDLDARVSKVEGWQKTVTSKWAVVVAIFLWVSPIVGKYALDKFQASKTPPAAQIAPAKP